HRHGASRANHTATSQKFISCGRRQQIHLELDAQDRRARGHETERGIAARAIRGGGEHAGVKKTVLLYQLGATGERDVHFTWRYTSKSCADRRHELLAIETRADARFERRVLRGE